MHINIVSCLLLVFVIVVFLLGRPVEGTEQLYYDADFEALYETDKAEDSSDKIVTTAPEADVGSQASASEVDAKAMAKDIYDSVDL